MTEIYIRIYVKKKTDDRPTNEGGSENISDN